MKDSTQKSSLTFSRSILPGVEIKRFSNSPQSYKHHIHKELSIGYILNGSSTVEFDGIQYHYKKGDGIVIPPLFSHMCSPKNINNWQVVMLYIDLSYYSDHLYFKTAAKLSQENLKKLIEFANLLETTTHKELLDEYLADLLLDIEAQTQNLSNPSSSEFIDNKVIQVKDYITQSFNKNISLNSLEKSFNINKFTLIRQFKKAYNTTPSSYQLQLKIAEAKKMLSQGKDVFNIINEVGFYDQAHFIREFKKMNGITPNAYLK